MMENMTMWSEEQLLASAWSAVVDAFDRKEYAVGSQADLFEREFREAYNKVLDIEKLIDRRRKEAAPYCGAGFAVRA